MNKRLLLTLLCVAFAPRASQAQGRPVVLTWDYNGQQKTLTLHLANYSGKDITAYSISISEKYADGSTNPTYLDGSPGIPGEKMEDLLGAMVNFQLAKAEHGAVRVGVLVNGQAPGTVDVERMRREFGNGTFAAGTTRDRVILEDKDISDVDAVVDMVVYADTTADVQNERAFRQLVAIRKGQLLAMEKVNEVIKRVLADPMVSSPITEVLTELTPLADAVSAKNRSGHPDEENQETQLRGDIQNMKNMQRAKMTLTTEREYLARYADEQEKRIALLSPHANLFVNLEEIH
jgi:hypothetical protein